MPGSRGARPRRASAGGLPLGRPAPPPLDRSPALGSPAGVASRRADIGARYGRTGVVRRPDARPSRQRRPDRRSDPSAARHRRARSADGRDGMRKPSHLSSQRSGLSVPSPLAGGGQGEGCHTMRSVLGFHHDERSRLSEQRSRRRSRPGPPLSPALPRKVGGSAPIAQNDIGSRSDHRGGTA